MKIPKPVQRMLYRSSDSYGVQEIDEMNGGRQTSGLLMSVRKFSNLVPEGIERRRACSDELPISIQLDAAWFPGDAIR